MTQTVHICILSLIIVWLLWRTIWKRTGLCGRADMYVIVECVITFNDNWKHKRWYWEIFTFKVLWISIFPFKRKTRRKKNQTEQFSILNIYCSLSTSQRFGLDAKSISRVFTTKGCLRVSIACMFFGGMRYYIQWQLLLDVTETKRQKDKDM